MLNKKQLISRIRALSPRDFCENHLFDDEVFVFNSENLATIGTYDQLRSVVSKKVSTAKKDIFIVGSSKLGYSLNPTSPDLLSRFRKNPIGDRKQSDIDLVIIDSDKFYECWNALISAYYGGYHRYDQHRKDIFRRFVSLRSDEEYPLKSLSSFVSIMGEIRRDIQTQFRLSRPINYRLYRSFNDALAYHEYGVAQLKEALRNAE